MNKNFGLKFTYCVLGIALLIFVFVLGFSIGVMSAFSDIKTYAGVVVEKEYLPEEVKEDTETKTIEKYDEQYIVKVKYHDVIKAIHKDIKLVNLDLTKEIKVD